MEILRIPIQVRRRNVLQQRRRLRRDQSRVHHVQLPVVLKLLACGRVDDRLRQRGKVAVALCCGGHSRNRVVRRAATRSVPTKKEKVFRAAVIKLWDFEWTADERTE